jgi:hypothetical protein
MASLQTLERRIQALEARLADVEGGDAETMYKMHRRLVKVDLRTEKMLAQMQLVDVTEDEVDAAIDAE